MARKRGKTRGGDMMTEVDFRDSKDTFGRIDAQTVGRLKSENMVKMLEIFLPSFTENENVVKINKDKWAGTENRVHEALEGLGSVFSPNGMNLN